jgi:hypothetical protein
VRIFPCDRVYFFSKCGKIGSCWRAIFFFNLTKKSKLGVGFETLEDALSLLPLFLLPLFLLDSKKGDKGGGTDLDKAAWVTTSGRAGCHRLDAGTSELIHRESNWFSRICYKVLDTRRKQKGIGNLVEASLEQSFSPRLKLALATTGLWFWSTSPPSCRWCCHICIVACFHGQRMTQPTFLANWPAQLPMRFLTRE